MPHTFTNPEIAQMLREVAAAYEIKGEPFYKIQAYDVAATSVEHATSMVKDLWDDDRLDELPGVGEAIAKYLDELFRTGEIQHFEEIKADLPKGLFAFLDIPGVGPKTASRLAKELKVQSLAELREAAEQKKIRELKGFGEKTEDQILRGIDELERRSERMLLPQASALANEIIGYLKHLKGVLRVDPLGSLRRGVATIGDIDLAVAVADQSCAPDIIKAFVTHQNVAEIVEQGEAEASAVWHNGKRLDLRVQETASYGTLLQHFTGSKAHNIHLRKVAKEKGWSLSEYGIRNQRNSPRPLGSRWAGLKQFADEESFYEFLGLEWIPPELREDTGEIEAAASGELPELVKLADIKGDLHLHCDFDLQESHDPGRSSMEDYARKAIALGHEYVAIGNHNPSVYNHSEQEIIDLIKRKQEVIDCVQEKFPQIKLLDEIEVDILADGRLAIPDAGLKLLDVVVVSIHSGLRQPKEKLTRRVVDALKNPYIHILGHPTGRLLTQREGYELDWDKVFAVAKEDNKAIEINAFYNRLDLPDHLVREAVERGVKLVTNTDSHHTDQMDLMKYGVSVARRGWASAHDILNTLPWPDMLRWLKER